jgi:hypothetical protein
VPEVRYGTVPVVSSGQDCLSSQFFCGLGYGTPWPGFAAPWCVRGAKPVAVTFPLRREPDAWFSVDSSARPSRMCRAWPRRSIPCQTRRRGPVCAAASLAAATKSRQEFPAAVENVPAWRAKFKARGRITSLCAAVHHSPALFAPHQPRIALGRPS